MAAPHVVVDIGSTTTKAVLFREAADGWEFVRREAPTTVEAPHADVKVGLRAALRALGEASGETLLDGDEPARPILLTSSAGGGLAMVVTGLVKEVTSLSAERTALGAGAVVQDVVALNDGRVPYRKIEDLKRLRPDMILFAGGFDGDAISGPVFLAELLRQADLHPKLDKTAALPILFAGNVNARDLVRETLGDGYLFREVANLRPASDRENLEEARAAIHETFMEHVMSHAPGYRELGSWVPTPILPTPSALARILETVTAGTDTRMLVIDIGGATTDIFTAANGEVFRTVSANLGMSYSALNVAVSGGMETVREVLGDSLEESEVWNRIGEKFLHPTRLARTPEEVRVEWALATAATRLAVKDHLEVLSGAKLSRGAQALGLGTGARGRSRRSSRDSPFPLTGYDLVVGSGGILSHSPREAAATILGNALEPTGPAMIAVDRAFVLPHLGALSRIDADLARRLFHEVALVRLGSWLGPVTKVKTPSATLRVSGGGIESTLGAQAVTAIPGPDGDEPTKLSLRGKGLKLAARTAAVSGGEIGAIVDARPRPLADRTATLVSGPVVPPVDDRPELPRGERIVRGRIEERRELAVPGEVLVAAGDLVTSDQVIARSALLFRRPFFLDVGPAFDTDAVGLETLLAFRPGDEIKAGDELAQQDQGRFRAVRRFVSPVAGTIERILPNGTMIVREKPDHAVENRVVKVARDMGLPPDQALAWLRVAVDQEIEKGQVVAQQGTGDQALISRSPIRGRVRSIDEEYGLVHLTPVRRDLAVDAWLPGRIDRVTELGAIVVHDGTLIRGTWGSGHEAVGPLSLDALECGHVAVVTGARRGVLEEARDAGVAGLIAGGLDLDEIRARPVGFPVVLTEGFGARALPDVVANVMRAHAGRPALLDGTTELRVGVRRPRIILPA